MSYTWPPSLDEAKDHLKLTDSTEDAQVQKFLDASVEIVEALAGPVGTTHTEWHDGGDYKIILDTYPIASVTSVTEYSGADSQVIASELEDSGTFTAYGYRYSATTGILYRTSSGYSTAWQGRVKVVYTTDISAHVVFAVLETVRLLWTKARGMGATEYPVSLSDIDVAYLKNLLPDRGVGVA